MTFGPVSPVKGNRRLVASLVLMLILGLLVGVATVVVPSEAATPPQTGAAPVLLYGVGDVVVSTGDDAKSLGMRRREVVFDGEALAALAQMKAAHSVSLSFFDNVAVVADIDDTFENLLGVRSFNGRVLDREHGHFMMSLDSDGRALLQVEILDDGLVYVVAEDPDTGLYYVSEYLAQDLRGTPGDIPARPVDDKTALPPEKVIPVTGDRVVADVLVAYTPAADFWARANRTGINNVIAQAIDRGNITLRNSDVDLRLRLVHAGLVQYEESGDYFSDLDYVTFHEGFDPGNLNPGRLLAEVHDWRAEYGADLVVLMNASSVSNLGITGVAWFLEDPVGEPDWGFSVVSVEYAVGTLIYEIGHNLGCHHSRNQLINPAPPEGGLFEYSTGWRWRGLNNRRYASTMTSPEFDFSTFQYDTKVHIFSNPDINYAGAPTGSYVGEYAPADNARSIREVERYIAGYVPQVVPDDDEGEGEEVDPEPSQIWYVNMASPYPTQDGQSWNSPFRTITQALSVASDNHEIWVARGLYSEGLGDNPAVRMKEGVRLFGGFVGMEENIMERDILANPTVINGNNERYAVVGAPDAVLDGFIVVRGGMHNDGVSPVVRNCAFGQNAVGMTNINASPIIIDSYFGRDPEDDFFWQLIDWGYNDVAMINQGGDAIIRGTGFYNCIDTAMRNENAGAVELDTCVFRGNRGGAIVNINATSVFIENSIFADNRAPRGGAIDNTNSTVFIAESSFVRNQANSGDGGAIAGGLLTIDTASFRENSATGNGGAIALPAAGSEIRNARFSKNRADGEGGALFLTAGIRMENCLVYGNSHGEGAGGAGIAIESGAPEIWNTTFARNFGYALHNMTNAANPRLTNCIIWGNENAIQNTDGGAAVITFSNVQGGIAGQGNINQDPLFRNINQGDMYLLAGSPSINSATAAGAPNRDIIGTDRPQGGQYDMGAWEYIGPGAGDSGEGPTTDPTEGEPEEGEGEDEEVPAASFEVTSLVRDRESLLPLHDWVPLFRFTMSYGEDEPAPRLLRRLVYTLVNDPNDDDRGLTYAARGDLHNSDVLEFGLFEDVYEQDNDDYGNFTADDRLLMGPEGIATWDHTSSFVTFSSETRGDRDGYAPLVYDVRFLDAPFIPRAAMEVDDRQGNAYIVAVRTSATWRSQLTLGVEVNRAEMIDFTGQMPFTVDDDGVVEFIDEYSPDFFGEDPEFLEAEAWYSASFGVFDPSGPVFASGLIEDVPSSIPTPNFWQHPNFLSIPPAEFTRPRWNKPSQLMSVIYGEFFEKRRIIALEEWTAVIGINLHSTRARTNADEGAFIFEANVVLTDIGADPYGPEGNGGFNPKNALKPVIPGRHERGTFGHHVVQNGIWLWRDVNGNAVFEPPTPNPMGGVTFNNDLPLPSSVFVPTWEYIPFPPGGGDPWWKISLNISADTDLAYTFIAPQPNNIFPDPTENGKFGSEFTYDYFVVTRFDSGFKDVSLREPTNTGATYGADFRAFIEPKRVDPFAFSYTGGLLATSQNLDFIANPDDPRWMPDEPWWPERTLNEKAAKPFRLGVEVHDMVSTYKGRLDIRDLVMQDAYWMFNFQPTTAIGAADGVAGLFFGYSPIEYQEYDLERLNSTFAAWLDPLFLDMNRFVNGHTVSIYKLVPLEFMLPSSLFGESYPLYARGWGRRQFAFERMPFFWTIDDLPPYGPRSTAYPTPLDQPTIPHLNTWPQQLEPGEFPAMTDWALEDARARILTQKVEANSSHTAMLGINLAGSADPIVNAEGNSVSLAQIAVAFWGPDFTPDMLKPLDPASNDNLSLDSGVLLWERGEMAGVGISIPITFLNSQDLDTYTDTPLPLAHSIIPVTGLRWASAPEFIDLNGNGLPDDMNGDGVLNEDDKAWVLFLYPKNQWEMPLTDDYFGTSPGSDLYITVSTSEQLGRFQQFRAVVPATLPSRAEGRRKAGIQFNPSFNTSPRAFLKANSEEDPVTSYYGHDMLQANIPVRIEDMAQRWSDIHIGGGGVPVLGLNIATNRPGTLARGDSGFAFDRSFNVPGQRWRSGELAGDYLIDERFESYEIVDNTADTLTLLSGTPRTGPWRVVRDPSFLEEVTVEFYQEGDLGNFNPLTDLLPLDIDQRISGVAIYRDNDNHPDNRNGMFDPDIDIPLTLDAPPRFSGRTAEDVKVRFVFSTPGTRDFPLPRAEQPRNRQWVHDSFGVRVSDPENGPDFFIVLRASSDMKIGDNLRAGIVSWGPNTPSEPDPHIWANIPGEERHDYLKFREFQWAERGVGFVTHFKEPPLSYFLHGAKASQRPDSSGLNWIRSHSTEKRRSGVITARNRPVGPRTLVIDSASQRRLPYQTLPGQGFNFLIYGKNFGNNPTVVLSGYDLIVNSAKDDTISVTISTRPDAPPQEPVTLVVRNPNSGDEASRSDLFSLTSDIDLYGPKIMRVNPARGRKADFPVVVEGMNFFNAPALEVRFGQTRMPILDVSPDGTAITVGFPVGGLPQTGLLDVFVANGNKTGGQDIKMNAFEYINPESRPKVRFFGCAPTGDAGSGFAGDAFLLGAVAVALAAARLRRKARV